MNRSQSDMPIQPIDYDAVWKEVTQRLFRDCLAFLFPQVETLINWEHKPTFLNIELPKLHTQTPRGMRRSDLVAQVQLHNHQPALILLHTEIQVRPDPNFAERMFVYFYHLRERYQLPVMSLAILADTNPHWRPSVYEYRLGQTFVHFEFAVAKLLDLEAKARAEEDTNPIAYFIQAHLASLKYRGRVELLAEEKKRLFRGMLERGYNRDEVRYLYQVVDYLMSLPFDLEREVEAVVEEIRRRRRRKWIAPQERLAIERALLEGREEGLQQGLQQGLHQGREEGIRQAVLMMLGARFGELPAELPELLELVKGVEKLNQLSVLSAQVSSAEEFLTHLRSISEQQLGEEPSE